MRDNLAWIDRRPRRKYRQLFGDIELGIDSLGHESIEHDYVAGTSEHDAVDVVEYSSRERSGRQLTERNHLVGIHVHHPVLDGNTMKETKQHCSPGAHWRRGADKDCVHSPGESTAQNYLAHEKGTADESNWNRALAE